MCEFVKCYLHSCYLNQAKYVFCLLIKDYFKKSGISENKIKTNVSKTTSQMYKSISHRAKISMEPFQRSKFRHILKR